MRRRLIKPTVYFFVLVFMSTVFVYLGVKVINTKPIFILNFLIKNKFISYVPAPLIKIDDVTQTLKIAPDVRGVVVLKKDNNYYYSVIGKISKSFVDKSLNPEIDERVNLDIPVRLETGQNVVIKLDNYVTDVYWDFDEVIKNEDKFESRSYFRKEDINGYYFVDQGYLFMYQNNGVNIIWKSDIKPREVLDKGSIIGDKLLLIPPEYIFVD